MNRNLSARRDRTGSALVLSDTPRSWRSVRSSGRRWAPPLEDLHPDDVDRIVAATANEWDTLLVRTLWATGGRVSEVLDLTPRQVRRDSVVLPNRKNEANPWKIVYLPGGQQDLTGALLLWARDQVL